jgi:roadblock/LC7 domain-containing protein
MPDLDKLMAMPGTLAAFEFNDRGELVNSRIADGSNLNETALDLVCHMCIANTSIATMQARGWESMTGAQGFYPINGFTLVGLEWSAVTSGSHGVVVKNGDADYEAAYAALAE